MVEIVQQWQYLGKPYPKLLEDKAFEHCKKAGLTSLQSYVYWTEIEKERGKIDFSSYDPLVEKLRKHNLKWVPFLILGPNYATPKWFQESKESVYTKCLEHQKESKIQSIWNPFLPKWVEIFLKLVAEHYRDHNILESITLGISGNWGEAIYPAEGGFYQDFHTHQGWWCGDKYARKSFTNFALEKYKSLKILNSAWGTNFRNSSEISFPSLKQRPEIRFIYPILRKMPKPVKTQFKAVRRYLWDIRNRKNQKPVERQRYIDFFEWYLSSMNDWVEFWLKTARKYFSNTKIYLVTGGIGKPISGADFSAQTKIAAKYKAGVRITNQTDNYRESFIFTRLISSAVRFYKTYFLTEEAGVNQPRAIPMRIFDMVTSGADGFYCKSIIGTGTDPCTKQTFSIGEPTEGAVNLVKNLKFLSFSSEPIIKTAVFIPNSSVALNPDILSSIYHQGAKLRALIDLDLVDENMISDGALKKYLFLVLLDGNWLQKRTFVEIKNWVSNGGVIIAPRHIWLSLIRGGEKVYPQLLFPQGKGLKRLDQGYIVLFPGKGKSYLDFIVKAVYNRKEEYPWSSILKIDGEWDGVYATQFRNKIMYYNSNNSKIRKKVDFLQKTIEIEGNSILVIPHKINTNL